MSRVPIRVRLTLAFAGVMAVVLATTGLFLHVRFAAALDDSVDEGLATRLADVRALVRDSDPSAVGSSSDLLVERDERFAQVLDTRGRVLGDASALAGRPALSGPQLKEARPAPFVWSALACPGWTLRCACSPRPPRRRAGG